MLVLTRKIGQQIVLPGCGVSIAVVEVGKNQVRLGITAPAATRVHRREVWDRVRLQRESKLEGRAAGENVEIVEGAFAGWANASLSFGSHVADGHIG